MLTIIIIILWDVYFGHLNNYWGIGDQILYVKEWHINLNNIFQAAFICLKQSVMRLMNGW